MKKYCEYIRVSTKQQESSGLGLSAQQKINRDYAKSVDGEIVATFKDVDSGAHRNRLGLWQAIEYCKENKTTLLVAKLDRLARDVEFIFKVYNTKIEIHFCDMPIVNTMILGVFASVAQYERELISQRTKAALAEKKKQGIKLGGTKAGCQKGGQANAEKRKKEATESTTNKMVSAMLIDCKTPQDIDRVAEKLNAMGLKTARGLEFTRNRLTALRAKIAKRADYAQNFTNFAN